MGGTFFIVWRAGTTSGVRHSTYEQAQGEAERLAAANPVETFFVLQALSESSRANVTTRRLTDDKPTAEGQ